MAIRAEDWFQHLTGHTEMAFRQLDTQQCFVQDKQDVWYLKNGAHRYAAGKTELRRVEDVRMPDVDHGVPLCVLVAANGEHLPVSVVQEALAGATFQVASNFNALEAVTEASSPEDERFLTDYVHDHTQGPDASVGAGAAAVYRLFLAQPINMASGWMHKHPESTMRNGYLSLARAEANRREGTVTDVSVLLHRDVDVTFYRPSLDSLETVPHPHRIHQVFCAALNCKQGHSGRLNREHDAAIDFATARLFLRAAYLGTYQAAIAAGSDVLCVTLLGNGAFGNALEWVVEALAHAHRALGGHFRRVFLIHYDNPSVTQWALYQRAFPHLKRIVFHTRQ